MFERKKIIGVVPNIVTKHPTLPIKPHPPYAVGWKSELYLCLISTKSFFYFERNCLHAKYKNTLRLVNRYH